MKKSNKLICNVIIIITFILTQYAYTQNAVWSENFESFSNGANYLGLGNTEIISNAGVNNSKCVEVEYERYDNGGTPRYLKKIAITPNTEYTLTYDILFTADWTISTGGKFHGLVPTNPTTGCQPIEADGWSSRVVFDDREPFLYTYHQDKDATCGEKTRNKTIQLEHGKWYAVTLHLKINTADDVNDGYTRLYINGELIAAQNNREFRSIINNETKITQFYFCTFLGAGPTGNIKSIHHARFDNFAIYSGEQIKNSPGEGLPIKNIPPSVKITSPINNTEFLLGKTIDLGAIATDSDGTVSKVNFKIDGNYYSTDISNPYTSTFTPTSAGTYTISARVFDNEGASTENSVIITVRENTCELIPYININNQGWNKVSEITVFSGDNVWFGPQSNTTAGANVPGWSWKGPNSFSYNQRSLLIENIQMFQAGEYTATYINENNCKASIIITLKILQTQVNQSIELIKGWNMVSLYVLPVNTSASDIFPNASQIKTSEKFLNISQPEFLNTLTKIELGVGYLVYNEIAETVNLTGIKDTVYAGILHKGWNLIGCPYSEPKSFYTVFGTEIDNINIIKNFDGFWENGNAMNSIEQIVPGKAYFIYK